jgi:hypothetical protein
LLFSLEDAAGVGAADAVRFSRAYSIAHQTASRDELRSRVDGRNCVTERQRRELLHLAAKEGIDADD